MVLPDEAGIGHAPQSVAKVASERILDAQHGGFTTGWSPASWGSIDELLVNLTMPPKHTFHLHLKETEWRYNHRCADKYKCLLQYLRKNPLS